MPASGASPMTPILALTVGLIGLGTYVAPDAAGFAAPDAAGAADATAEPAGFSAAVDEAGLADGAGAVEAAGLAEADAGFSAAAEAAGLLGGVDGGTVEADAAAP